MAIGKILSYDEIYNIELSHLPNLPGITQFKHFIATTSQTMRFPSDQVRFLVVILSFIIFGYLFRFVPGKTLKNLYCLTLGFCGTWIIMGPPALNMIVSSMIVYLFVEIMMPVSPKWLKNGDKGYDKAEVYKQKIALYEKRQNIGRYTMYFSMFYICASHIYRYISDYMGYRLDFTAAQMLLTIKISAYAWNRVDGMTLNDGIPLTDIRGDEDFRRERAIHERPSLLTYLAWVYHFTSCLAGPSIDYREYEMYLDGSLWKQYGLEECPDTIMATLTKLMYCAMVYPGVYILSKWPLGLYLGTPQYYLDHPTLFQRALYVCMFNGFSRFKYYFAWYISEAASVSTGIGISGYDKKTGVVQWDRCNGSRAWLIESCTSVPDMISSWNIRCSEWLKHYVYLRATLPTWLEGKISQRTFADTVTKFTSAFWHGVYPGYYLFFLQVVFITTYGAQLDKILQPFFFKENPANPRKPIKQFPIAWVYTFIANCFTLFSFNWLGCAFIVLEFFPTFELLYSTYFWYHILLYVLLFIVPSLVCPRKKKDKQAEVAVVPAAAEAKEIKKD